MAERKAKKEPTFEQGLEQLEGIAEQMERGELPLDQLLKLYEEGMQLSNRLNRQLDAMDSRMQEVHAGKDGTPELHPTDVTRQESLFAE